MPGQENRSPVPPVPQASTVSSITQPEQALSSPSNHRDLIRDSDIFAKDNDYGEKLDDSDLEAQEEPVLEKLPSDEQDRDAALSGGIEGRTLNILSRVKSKPDSVNNIKSIPNGGLRAWLQVAGAWVLFLNTWWVQFLSLNILEIFVHTRNSSTEDWDFGRISNDIGHNMGKFGFTFFDCKASLSTHAWPATLFIIHF